MMSFLRSFAAVSYGSLAGQFIAAAASPLLSRIFTPADYGATGVVISVTMMLTLMATMRYDEVIVAGRTSTSRSNAFSLSFLVLATVCALLLLAILLAVPVQRRLGHGHTVTALLLFAPLILFLTVAQSRILPALLIRFGRLQLVSLGHFLYGTVGAAAQIALGLFGLGAFGLLLGRTIGLLVALATYVVPSWRTILVPVLGATRRRTLRQVLRGYRNQAYFLAPAGFMNTAATQLPVFVLATSFGAAASGAFFFCQTLANASLSIYRRSIMSLTAKEAQSILARGDLLMPFMLRLIGLATLLSSAGAAVLFIYGERLLPLVFGSQWGMAGVAAKWMSFYFAATVVHMAAAGLTTLLRFQRSMLAMEVGQFVVTALALAIGTAYGSFELTVALIGIATSTVFAVHLLSIFRVIRQFERGRTGATRPTITAATI